MARQIQLCNIKQVNLNLIKLVLPAAMVPLIHRLRSRISKTIAQMHVITIYDKMERKMKKVLIICCKYFQKRFSGISKHLLFFVHMGTMRVFRVDSCVYSYMSNAVGNLVNIITTANHSRAKINLDISHFLAFFS